MCKNTGQPSFDPTLKRPDKDHRLCNLFKTIYFFIRIHLTRTRMGWTRTNWPNPFASSRRTFMKTCSSVRHLTSPHPFPNKIEDILTKSLQLPKIKIKIPASNPWMQWSSPFCFYFLLYIWFFYPLKPRMSNTAVSSCFFFFFFKLIYLYPPIWES